MADETAPHAAPDDPLFSLRIAIARLGEGQSRAALEAASEACHHAPGLLQAHYAYGEAWLALNQPVRAEQAFAASLQLAPRWAEAWVNCGVARYRQSAIEDARTAMRQALQSAQGEFRGFWVQSSNVAIQNMTIADAAAIGGGGRTGRYREAWRSA